MLAVAPSRHHRRPHPRNRAQSRGHARVSRKSQFPRLNTRVSGRRYYSPANGRFLGRDPIKEKGGLNLYGFVINNPINLWEYLGMETEGETRYYIGVLMIWHNDGPYGPGWYANEPVWGGTEGGFKFFPTWGSIQVEVLRPLPSLGKSTYQSELAWLSQEGTSKECHLGTFTKAIAFSAILMTSMDQA